MYRILLVFDISNKKTAISSCFQAFSDLNIPYLEYYCPNISQEYELEVFIWWYNWLVFQSKNKWFLSSYMFLIFFLMHVWKSSSIRDGCISIFSKCIQSTSQILVLNSCSESRTGKKLILILAPNNFLLNFNSCFSVFS